LRTECERTYKEQENAALAQRTGEAVVFAQKYSPKVIRTLDKMRLGVVVNDSTLPTYCFARTTIRICNCGSAILRKEFCLLARKQNEIVRVVGRIA
jgi:hypothetical protein